MIKIKSRLIAYLLIFVLTIITVIIFVNALFNGLHDGGAVGMVFGLMFSQLVLTIAFLQAKWLIVAISTLINAVLPVFITKQMARYLYGMDEDGVIGYLAVDTISYIIYFVLLFSFYELEFRVNNEAFKSRS